MRAQPLRTAGLAAMAGALLACVAAGDDRSGTVDAAPEAETIEVAVPAPVAAAVAPAVAPRGHWVELGAPDAAGDEHIRGGLAVAIDPAGGVTAVWRQGEVGSADRAGVLWANHYRPDAGWGAATRIQPDASYGNAAPMVVADNLGRATVIWAAGIDGAARDLWANRYVPGAGWTGPTRIETDPGDVVGALPQVDSAGRVTVFWRQRDGGASRLRSNRYDPATGWGSAADAVGAGPTLAADVDAVDVRTPVLAAEPRGRVAMAWSRGRHVGVRVFAP